MPGRDLADRCVMILVLHEHKAQKEGQKSPQALSPGPSPAPSSLDKSSPSAPDLKHTYLPAGSLTAALPSLGRGLRSRRPRTAAGCGSAVPRGRAWDCGLGTARAGAAPLSLSSGPVSFDLVFARLHGIA